MDALMAIALLCQVAIGSASVSFQQAEMYQSNCHKQYITCYEGKLKALPEPVPPTPGYWFGRLKECVKEREVK